MFPEHHSPYHHSATTVTVFCIIITMHKKLTPSISYFYCPPTNTNTYPCWWPQPHRKIWASKILYIENSPFVVFQRGIQLINWLILLNHTRYRFSSVGHQRTIGKVIFCWVPEIVLGNRQSVYYIFPPLAITW